MQIKHLYLRAGFGLNAREWMQRKDWSIKKAVNELFGQAEKSKPLATIAPVNGGIKSEDRKERFKFRTAEKQLVKKISVDWLLRMADPRESSLMEKMSLFWHGHFACRSRAGYLANNQLNTIRKYGLGSFKELVLAIAKDAAMIRYLDNHRNKKNNPNENFARELMELFTIGIGHYTEQDVKEAARAFTGWNSDKQGVYELKERQHDYGRKTFMNKEGRFNGGDIIDIILEKNETAYFITKKIYSYFVNEQIDEPIVKELADSFYRSDYDIKQLMLYIFESDWFYDPKNIGTKIKSPTEFTVGIFRQLNGVPTQPRALLRVQKALGQTLFNPPNVAGWGAGKYWIDNSTLMLRLSLPTSIFNSSNLAFSVKPELEDMGKKRIRKLSATIDLDPIIEMTEGLNTEEILETLQIFLLQSPLAIPQKRIQSFVLEKEEREKFLLNFCIRLMSLPEYQMC